MAIPESRSVEVVAAVGGRPAVGQKGELYGRHSRASSCCARNRGSIRYVFESMYQGHPSSKHGLLYATPSPSRRPAARHSAARQQLHRYGPTRATTICVRYAIGRCRRHKYYITTTRYISREGMELTEGMDSRDAWRRNDTRTAAIESNNGGRGFARSVQRLAPLTRVEWFHQSGNKEARILSNSATAVHLLRFPHGWHLRWPEMYAHLTTYRRLFRSNRLHDAADDHNWYRRTRGGRYRRGEWRRLRFI